MKRKNIARIVLRNSSVNLGPGTVRLLEIRKGGTRPTSVAYLDRSRQSIIQERLCAHARSVSFLDKENKQAAALIVRAASLRFLLLLASAHLVGRTVQLWNKSKQCQKSVLQWAAGSSLRSPTSIQSQLVAAKVQISLPRARIKLHHKNQVWSNPKLSNAPIKMHLLWLALSKTVKIPSLLHCSA